MTDPEPKLPDYLQRLCDKAQQMRAEKQLKAPDVSVVSDANLAERARAYITKMPPAISGQGGHNQTLCVARVLVHDFALPECDAWPLLHEYNATCQPPWSEKELRHKLSEAQKLSQAGQCERTFGNLRNDDTQVNLDGILKPTEPPFQFAREILDTFKHLRTPIIHGLLREGETMNIIAPPKTGKTWLTMELAFGIATGKPVLGFETRQGRVLILDNELHGETVAHRLPAVAESKGVLLDEYADKIAYKLLRGQLKDIYSLEPILKAIPAGYFKVIVMDAFYRFLPKDVDENDNGSMSALYNKIDSFADQLRCAFIAIHHTSKGLQSTRAVTDVGAGAGAISRAADCHLILRPHREAGAVVLDATPRSWPPVPSRCLRFNYPRWTAAPELDPAELLMSRTKKKTEAETDVSDPVEKWTRKRFVAEFITDNGRTKPAILAAVEDRDDSELSCYRAERFIETAEGAGEIFRWDNGPKKPPCFATVPQPEIRVNEREGESGFALAGC